MINASVTKTNNESSTNTIRRFTKRMKGSGVLRRVRAIRYHQRKLSAYVQKKQTLQSLQKKVEYERDAKLGKIPEKTYGRR